MRHGVREGLPRVGRVLGRIRVLGLDRLDGLVQIRLADGRGGLRDGDVDDRGLALVGDGDGLVGDLELRVERRLEREVAGRLRVPGHGAGAVVVIVELQHQSCRVELVVDHVGQLGRLGLDAHRGQRRFRRRGVLQFDGERLGDGAGVLVDAAHGHRGLADGGVARVVEQVVHAVAQRGVAQRHRHVLRGEGGGMVGVHPVDGQLGGHGHGRAADVGGIDGLAQADFGGGHELVVAGIRIGVDGLEPHVLGGHRLIELGELPAVIGGPCAGARVGPVGAVIADLNLVFGDGAVLAARGARQVAQRVELGGFLELEGDPQVVHGGGRPVGMPVRAGVAVDREFLRAFGRGAGRLFAAHGDRHVGGRVVAFIGVCGEFLLRAQVDGEGLARDVVLGLGDHADHVVVRGQHGDAGVAFALGFDVRDDRGRVVGAGGEHGVGDLRAVHRQRRERGGRVRDELAGRGLQLDLGQAGADHAAGGCGVGVGDRDLDERGSHRSEVIGVRLDSVGRLLGRDGLRGSEIRPVLAVRGDLDLRLAGVGEPHRVAVAEEVHDNLAELLLGRVLEGDLGGVVAGLRVRPVGPCGRVRAAAGIGVDGRGAVLDGVQRVGLLVGGDVLSQAQRIAGDAAADGDLRPLHADRRGDLELLAEDGGGAGDLDGAGRVVHGVSGLGPVDGEVRAGHGAVGQHGRTRARQHGGRADRCAGRIVEQRTDLVDHRHAHGDLLPGDRAGHAERTGLGDLVVADCVPCNVLTVRRAVGVAHLDITRQNRLVAGLDVVVARVEEAADRLLGAGAGDGGGGDLHCG